MRLSVSDYQINVLPEIKPLEQFDEFIAISEFKFLHKSFEPNQAIPSVYDYIDIDDKSNDSFTKSILNRILLYPSLQNFFMTTNSEFQMKQYLMTYAVFKTLQINIIQFTPQMRLILHATRRPFCCIVNHRNQILFAGEPGVHAYHIQMRAVDSLAFKARKDKFSRKNRSIAAPKYVANGELSLALSGLLKKQEVKRPVSAGFNEMELSVSSQPLSTRLKDIGVVSLKLKPNVLEKDKIDFYRLHPELKFGLE